MDQCPEISHRGIVYLTCFAIAAGTFLWLWWRKRNENYRLVTMLRFRTERLENFEAAEADRNRRVQ